MQYTHGRAAGFARATLLVTVLTLFFAQSASAVSGAPVFQRPVLASQTLSTGCSYTHSTALRSLASAHASQLKAVCKRAQRHAYKVQFWLAERHRWTLYLGHTDLTCAQLNRREVLVGPEALCFKARAQVRNHSVQLARLVPKIRQLVGLASWQGDLSATASRRVCIANVETPGSTHPYTQQGGGGGNYWGKYQYDEGTWQTARREASDFYHIDLPYSDKASQAPAWEQEVVTAFALAHSDKLGWIPWQECR